MEEINVLETLTTKAPTARKLATDVYASYAIDDTNQARAFKTLAEFVATVDERGGFVEAVNLCSYVEAGQMNYSILVTVAD